MSWWCNQVNVLLSKSFNHLSIISSLFLQYILEATDPFIQIAFINTLKIIEETYPIKSNFHIVQLLEFGKRSSRKFCSTLHSHSLFLDRICQSSRCTIELFFNITFHDIHRCKIFHWFCYRSKFKCKKKIVHHIDLNVLVFDEYPCSCSIMCI